MEQNQLSSSLNIMSKELLTYLTKLEYSEVRVNRYQTCAKHIQSFMTKEGITLYNSEACELFIKHLIGKESYQELSRWHKDDIRCANTILEYNLTGNISYRSSKKKFEFNGTMGTIISDYLIYRRSRNISKDTLDSNRLYLVRFQKYLDTSSISDFKNISQQDILSFVKSLSFYTSATRHCILCSLRGFLKYLYQSNTLCTDWSYLVPKDNYKKEARLPTTYTKDEVESILNAVDRGNPKGKRDYAILLLASRLGLRASDICRMTFENIVWEQNIIILNQQKTGRRIELPILSDVGNAIIDYLKYARPNSNSIFVFLHVNPSYERLQEPTIHSIVYQYMKYAGIPIQNKKHGPHALRHSLAGFLLEKKTPIYIISEVLGHKNIETTKSYLRIDLSSLRQCALEVPSMNTTFYSEGGYIDD
ncbi:site-specific integrase [Clostridium sp.]|uniref:site-specific integrase n=1 Tax=Clostridium sp. TaxID=1506 RepID=UPI003D6CF3B2